LASCSKSKNENVSAKENLVAKTDTIIEPEFHKELYGIYSGDFTGRIIRNLDEGDYDDDFRKLSLKINRITKDSVYGQSIVAGNQRPFRGVFNENSKTFILDEPGNDKTDGRFQVDLKGDSLTGNWTAFTKNAVKIPTKKLKLIKKEFVYNANFMLEANPEGEDNDNKIVDWANPKIKKESYKDEDGKMETYDNQVYRSASNKVFSINASKQKLAEKDVKNLRKLDLEIIKNTVFARHGFSFKKQTFRNFFEFTDWYVPVSNNVDADLTPLEKENVALLNRFTKYAEDKYDSFGR
jgi:hypothetical protein